MYLQFAFVILLVCVCVCVCQYYMTLLCKGLATRLT